jgi:hypothetical protein
VASDERPKQGNSRSFAMLRMTGSGRETRGDLLVAAGSVLGRVWRCVDPTPGVSVTCRKKEGWRLRNLEVCTKNGKRGTGMSGSTELERGV